METRYIVDIEYVTRGDPGGGMGKLADQADAFAKSQKALGKELVGLGRSAADAYTGAVEAAGRLVATGAGAALGAGLAGAVYGVTTINAGLEATQYSLAAIGEANGWVSTFSEGLSHASALMQTMRKDAAAGLGTYEDLAHIFASMATPAGQAGMTEAATEAMASKFMNFAKVQGVSQDVAARQAANLLAGRAGAHNTIGSRLGLMGESAKAFNASSASQRAATLEKLLAEKLRPDALAAFTNTYAAQSTTLISSLKEFGGKSTEALFDRVVVTLREANTWIAANKGEVDHWAYAISSKLTSAWDTGKRLILEWTPLVVTFAENAATRISSIWDEWKPTIVSLGETLKQALTDPATFDKLEKILGLYGAMKIGGGMGGPIGSGLQLSAAAVGVNDLTSQYGKDKGGDVGQFLGSLSPGMGIGKEIEDASHLFSDAAKEASEQAEMAAKNMYNLAGNVGEVDKSSILYLDTLAMLSHTTDDAHIALVEFAVDVHNASIGLNKLINKQIEQDTEGVLERHPFDNSAAVAAFLRGDKDKKKKGPEGGAGHNNMVVYMSVSSNQSPGQIAQSVVKALATAKSTKKFSVYGNNLSARGTISMAGSTTWTFTQLAGTRTVLSLDGWSAPFGRARKEALVKDSIEIRKAEVYYPGVETGPTRHIFGRKYPTRELHGRFRDRWGGPGYAKAKALECKAFVAAQQPVRIAWSDQLSEVGFVDSFEAERESEGEIAWKLNYSCDSDDYDSKPALIPVRKLPADFALVIYKDAQPVLGPPLGVPGMQGSIFDTLNSMLNVVGNLLTDLFNVVSGIDDFLDASFGVLRRVLTMTAQIRGNVLAIDEFFAEAGVGGLLFTSDAASSVALWEAQTACDLAVMQWLADVASLEREVQIALSGRPSTAYVATQGDTWEDISTRSYGSPDRAGDLCAANGNVQAPIPGTAYQVPQ